MSRESTKTFLFFSQNFTFQKIYNSLSLSLGPFEKSLIYFRKNKELIFLNNGLQIVESFDSSSKEEKILLKTFHYLSKKNLDLSGDGSTSVSLIFYHLLNISLFFLSRGYNASVLTKAIYKLSLFISYFIFENSIPVRKNKEIKGIIRSYLANKISPHDKTFFENSFENIKREGLIQIEESFSSSSRLEIIKGIEIEKGFTSPYFINDINNFLVSYENALLIISSSDLENICQIEDVIQYSKSFDLPLVIITKGISKELLSTLVLNTIKKKVKLVVIKFSSINTLKTGLLEDLALLTHSKYEENSSTNRNLTNSIYGISDLGFVHKVIITSEKSTFFFSKFSNIAIDRRINELYRESQYSETNYEKNLFETRISRLKGNLMKIHLSTDKAKVSNDRRKKIENLLITLKASIEEGCLPGGTSFYIFLLKRVKFWSNLNLVGDEIYLSQIFTKSLSNFVFDFYRDLSIDNISIFQNLFKLSYPFTYDLVNHKYVNAFDSSLLNSSKSIRLMFNNSLSLFSTLITSYGD